MKVIGLYDWSGNYPVIPELWLVPQFLPFHPGTFLLFYKKSFLEFKWLESLSNDY